MAVNIGHVVQAVVGGRIRRESYPYKMGTILVGTVTRHAGVKGLAEPDLFNSGTSSRSHVPYYGSRIDLFNRLWIDLVSLGHLLSYTASFFVGLTFESRLNNRSPAT